MIWDTITKNATPISNILSKEIYQPCNKNKLFTTEKAIESNSKFHRFFTAKN
jgi:hypothetical protein